MKFSFIELLVKGIPEGFLDVFAMYVFTRTKFDLKKYILMSLAFIVLISSVRLLPISNGVNTMLAILVLVIFFIVICKTDPSKTIKSAVIVAIVLFISEMLNVGIIIAIFGKEATEAFFNNSVSKSLIGIPSTLIFAAVIVISHLLLSKRDKRRGVVNGEAGKENSK